MKRILCLLLTLALLTGAALAEHFSFSLADFVSCTHGILPQLGYRITWEDCSEAMGFTSIAGTFDSFENSHGVFVHDDPVLAIEMVYTFTVTAESTDESVDQSLTEFTAVLVGGGVCAWLAEHIADDDIKEALSAANARSQAELALLTSPLRKLDSTYTGEKRRQEGTLFGYPAVLTIEHDASTGFWRLGVLMSNDADLIESY